MLLHWPCLERVIERQRNVANGTGHHVMLEDKTRQNLMCTEQNLTFRRFIG